MLLVLSAKHLFCATKKHLNVTDWSSKSRLVKCTCFCSALLYKHFRGISTDIKIVPQISDLKLLS